MKFSVKLILKYLFLVGLLVLAMKVTGGAGFAIIFPLAVWALFTNRHEDLFFYMLLTIVTVVGNPNVFSRSFLFVLEQRLMMALFGFLMALRVFGQRKSPLLTALSGVVAYVVYMILPSAQGWCAPVSFLKILLFLLVFFAYFGAANALAVHPRENLILVRSMVLAIAIVFIWGSVCLIPFPGYGLMRSNWTVTGQVERSLTSLFMGMTSHSQCLGPIISALATLLLADWLFGIRKFSKLYFCLLIFCPILIWKTGSRGALFTFSAGVLFVLYFFMRTHFVGSRWRNRVLTSFFLVSIFGMAVILINPNSRESLQRFLVKHGVSEGEQVTVTMENITSSRRGLVETALENFRQSPMFGNGFQVNEDMKRVKVESLRDILSAPIEKGVWVVAILEEGGVVGFVLFVTFILTALTKLIRLRAYITASIFFVFVFSNMGEFSFFSMSYLGGFMWALVFTGVLLDSSRAKSEIYEQMRRNSFQQL